MQNYHLKNRPERELTDSSEIAAILKNGKYTVVSMCRDNKPYVVTLSYGYDTTKNALYFHCAPAGLKLDFINANQDVCATVIEDGGYIADECGHRYRTVVFRGTMKLVVDLNEKKHGMKVLLHHLEKKPEVIKEKLLNSDNFYEKMEILRLDIVDIHGKAGR